ncbi:MAG: sodium:solute symporter [Fidelibacterota bacterium]
MTEALHPADLAVILSYLAFLIGLGFFRSRDSLRDENDYLLAGRRLTLIPFTASLVATWYGGILGVGEFTYRYGVSNWVVFGLPYYVFALGFAFLLAERIRSAELTTIPDRFYEQYGRLPGILSAVLVMILASPAPYILSVGVILRHLFHLSWPFSLVVATLLSLVYIYTGGFRSVIRTDLFQFALMFSGFAVILVLSVRQFGGLSSLTSELPPLHLSWHGGLSGQTILVWFFIALWTFVDPGFYQRCAAARSGKVARRGILVSIGFWTLFDFLTLTTGLYARMTLPHLGDPLMALPTLGQEVLPPVLLGLFFAGLLATVMSTVDSLGLISAITFGRDILWRLAPRSGDSVRWTQMGLLVTAAVSVVLAWAFPSVVKLWYAIGTVAVPGLLIPFLSTFWKEWKIPAMAAMMAVSAGISLAWLLAGVVQGAQPPAYPLGIEPFYPGLAASIVWVVVGRAARSWRRGLHGGRQT